MATIPGTVPSSPGYTPAANRLLAFSGDGDVPTGDRFTPSAHHGSVEEVTLMHRARSGDAVSRHELHQYWNRIIDQDIRQRSPGGLHQALTDMAPSYRDNPDDQFSRYRLHAISQRANELRDLRLQQRVAKVRDLSASTRVRPQSQPAHTDWCGITSVAMVSEKMSGRRTSPDDIHSRYGYGLQSALNAETGRVWQDRDFNSNSWSAIQKSLAKGRPVIVGTGKPFSVSDRHIFVITGVRGDRVTYADPNGGVVRTTTRRTLDNADPYPQGGKFMFISP